MKSRSKTGVFAGAAALAATAALLFWASAAPAAASEASDGGVWLEARGGFFLGGSKAFRTSYKPGPAFGFDLTVSVGPSLGIWAGAGYFAKNGLTSFTEEPLKIRLLPVYAGLRVRLSRGKASPYLGAAGGYFLYREESETDVASGGTPGFLGQAGLAVQAGRSFGLDFYVRYSYARVKAGSPDFESSNIGGLEAGLGLGVRF